MLFRSQGTAEGTVVLALLVTVVVEYLPEAVAVTVKFDAESVVVVTWVAVQVAVAPMASDVGQVVAELAPEYVTATLVSATLPVFDRLTVSVTF